MQSSITHYFLLQIRRLYRGVIDSGIPLPLALIGIVALYFGGSTYLYFKTDFAPYILALLALSIISKLSGFERNDFLANTFSRKEYLRLRAIENQLVVLPFVCMFVFHKNFIEAIALIGAAFLMAFMKTKNVWNRSLPTPFSKRPYEFVVGFRSSMLFILLAYSVLVFSIVQNNFNIAAAGLVLIYIISLTFYLQPEPAYYVWIYTCTPRQFLRVKLLTSIRQSSLLALPMMATMFIVFPEQWYYSLLFVIIGKLFLITTILAKYSAFPNEINVPEGILMAICISFPPFLLVLIPYFYQKAMKNLEPLLS